MGQGEKVDCGSYYLVKRGVSHSFRWLLRALLILLEKVSHSLFNDVIYGPFKINGELFEFL